MGKILKNVRKSIQQIISWEKEGSEGFSLSALPAERLQDVLKDLYGCTEAEIIGTYKEGVNEAKYRGQGLFWRELYPILGDIYEELYLAQKKSNETFAVLDHQSDSKLYFFSIEKNLLIDTTTKPKGQDIIQFREEFKANQARCLELETKYKEKMAALNETPHLKTQISLEKKFDELDQEIERLKRKHKSLKEQLQERENRKKKTRDQTQRREF